MVGKERWHACMSTNLTKTTTQYSEFFMTTIINVYTLHHHDID